LGKGLYWELLLGIAGRTRNANWVTPVSWLLSNFQLDSQEPDKIYNKVETLLEAR
jgi:hypothetical protein